MTVTVTVTTRDAARGATLVRGNRQAAGSCERAVRQARFFAFPPTHPACARRVRRGVEPSGYQPLSGSGGGAATTTCVAVTAAVERLLSRARLGAVQVPETVYYLIYTIMALFLSGREGGSR